jgi:hypothetical protein
MLTRGTCELLAAQLKARRVPGFSCSNFNSLHAITIALWENIFT